MRLSKPKKIGGRGIVVQIDESKFSKRKYHVGRLVRSVWVVGGIDELGETFFVDVISRTREVLHNIIQEYVHEQSFIFTDEWRGYSNLNELGYFHYTVNHSKNFINPITGVNTQKIESLWCVVKKSIRRRCLSNMIDFSLFFIEYCFKKKYSDSVFETFLKFSTYVVIN
jgi:transposase-like protein